MLDVRLGSHDEYIGSCVKLAEERLSGYKSVAAIEKDLDSLNAYPNLEHLDEPKGLTVLDKVPSDQIRAAEECLLSGRFFAEHTAAGEATRLGLGTKFLLDIAGQLPAQRIAELVSQEKGQQVTPIQIIEEAGCRPEDLMPISLGARHMLQYSFDLARLAERHGLEPDEVLARQRMLLILNEETADEILQIFVKAGFFGFSEENTYFMVQKSYHGISLGSSGLFYDTSSPKRLHNHGQMVMQETMEKEIFVLSGGSKRPVPAKEFESMLGKMDDKQSFNIEDLGFLVQSVDLPSLALALQLSKEGYGMVMEIVGNNPENPQKGGMAAFDSSLGRNVMVEGFQLKGISNEEIRFLNKNFNHYPLPAESWRLIRAKGLPMPFSIKDRYIYYQPVQGDINFLVKTAFVQRRVLKPIQAWKSPGTTALAMRYMRMQDQQPGFREHAARFT